MREGPVQLVKGKAQKSAKSWRKPGKALGVRDGELGEI